MLPEFDSAMSESEGRQVAQEIFDAVKDTCLQQDPKSKVAYEAVAKEKVVYSELTIETQAKIEYDEVARAVYRVHKRRLAMRVHRHRFGLREIMFVCLFRRVLADLHLGTEFPTGVTSQGCLAEILADIWISPVNCP